MTLETAQSHLDAWIAADLAVSQGQEYEIETGGSRRKLKRVDARLIKENINYWNSWVVKLTTNKSRLKRVIPID